MKKRIAIIGKGTAGSLAFNHFANFGNFEVECYFDSSIKEQSVGEGAPLNLGRTLYESLGLEYEDIFKIQGNYKAGIKYINWGQSDYFHSFPMPNMSLHFSATDLQELLYKKNEKKVNFIDKKITKTSDIDADHIMLCTGRPVDFTDYNEAKYIPVNAAYVIQCYWDRPMFDYTLCIARPYGWVFGIPLQNRVSFGYLYNHNIDDIKDIENDLLNVIKEYGYNPSDETNSLKFKNYYRQRNYWNHISYNGNASFFLEPMEATSIASIDHINRQVFDILRNRQTLTDANAIYKQDFKRIQEVITMHYLAGSKWKTKFWKYAGKLATRCLENGGEEYSNIIKLLDTKKEIDEHYGTWHMHSFRKNVFGLGIQDILKNTTFK
jgi:tryptophan halogenase